MKKDAGALKELGFDQAPHFTTHAVEFFKEVIPSFEERWGPADIERFLCGGLTSAVKFLLPDNGYLFDGEHDYKPSMFELLHLPFPVCAIEFRANQELFSQDSGLVHAEKRIALCFDPHRLPEPLSSQLAGLLQVKSIAQSDLPARALSVLAVYEAQGIWGSSIGMVTIDLDNDKPVARETQDLDGIADRVAQRLAPAPLERDKRMTKHGLPATFHVFRARAQLMGKSPDEAYETVYIDTIDEMRAAFEFIATLNCANVGLKELPAPRMLNEKRQKKGKTPFYPYKILDLVPASAYVPGQPGGGTSPRAHLRRGHIRKLGEKFGNKAVWINATVVNSGKGSGGDSNYLVRP